MKGSEFIFDKVDLLYYNLSKFKSQQVIYRFFMNG